MKDEKSSIHRTSREVRIGFGGNEERQRCLPTQIRKVMESTLTCEKARGANSRQARRASVEVIRLRPHLTKAKHTRIRGKVDTLWILNLSPTLDKILTRAREHCTPPS